MFSYLDPGTGSMLVSIFGSGLAGFGILWKMLRFKATGKSMPVTDSSDEDESESAHD